ncbi:helix-turn-helix domain-containing protein [Candidatus Kaiserbacteria bacterium]|nr:helix-turn-helix domain-containing protein [Candidatus Kaiserbacteria bacterium]
MRLTRLRYQAVRLRRKGLSYGEIRKKLHIPKSTLSAWLRYIPLSEEDKSRLYNARIRAMVSGPNCNRARRLLEIDSIVQGAGKEISHPISRDAHLLLGAALYWAEGSKSGAISITNSDPVLIAFMVRWFSDIFLVSPKGFKAWLNIYSQQNDAHLKRFWSSITGIPVSRFGKSFIKPRSKGIKKNNLYYGTIKIRIPKSTDNKHRIFGWLQGALREYHSEYVVAQRKWIQLRTVERPANLDYS